MKCKRLSSIIKVKAHDYKNNIMCQSKNDKLDGSELEEELHNSKENAVRAFERIHQCSNQSVH